MESYTALGRTDLQVSRLGFGAARIGEGTPLEEVEILLNTLLDLGITFLDTADCYVQSEELIGRFLGRRLRECVLATKCGCLTDGAEGVAYSRPIIAASIERSLQRLGVDQLDLVFLHTCSAAVLRAGEAVEALEEARAAGKVRYTGYSGDGEDALEAISMGVFDALQVTFNLVSQGALVDVLPAAKRAGMGVVVKRPIANAQLIDSKSAHFRDGAYWDPVRSLLTEEGLLDDPLELSLRFTLSHEVVDSAIVGTSTAAHARDNAGRARAGELPAQVMGALHQLGRDT